MKKTLFLFLVFSGIFAGFIQAQEIEKEEEKKILFPIIDSIDSVSPKQPIDFSAKPSKLLDEAIGLPRFIWDFGDNLGFKWGEKVSYTYKNPGQYVVQLQIKQGPKTSAIKKTVTVYTRKGLLIGTKNTPYQSIIDQASKKGMLLEFVLFEKDEKGLSGEAEFAKKLSEKIETLKTVDSIIFHNDSGRAFQAFSQWWKHREEKDKFPLEEKLWIQITNESLSQAKKLIETVIKSLSLEKIIVTRSSALNTLFEKEPENFVSEINNRGIDALILDGKSKKPFFLLFSKVTNYFIEKGVSQSIIYFLLTVPFIVFIISFFRQFIGVSTFGVFAPLVLTLSFMLLGLNFGFLVFLLVMVVSYGIRILFSKFNLLYIPKVSLLFSALSLSFFFVLGLAIYFGVSIDFSLAVFPMIVMSTISEKFMSAQSEEGFKGALVSTAETVAVSFIAYVFVKWEFLENSVLSSPELILLPILGNIWLGRFTGLRITEYFKFRSILRGNESQE